MKLYDVNSSGIIIGNTRAGGGFGVKTYIAGAGQSTPLWQSTGDDDAFNTTHFIVVELVSSGSAWNGTIWIDPAANTSTAPTATATFTTASQYTFTKLLASVPGGGKTVTIDEWRVGNSWADVSGYIPLPAAPTTLTATPGANTVALSWSSVSGATSYQVVRGTASMTYTVTNTVTAPTTTYNDNSAVGGTTYYYAVAAVNSSGAGPYSPEKSATPTIAPPTAPTTLTAVGTNGAVNLSWSGATGAATYEVKRSTGSGGGETNLASVSGTSTSYSDTTVINGLTYYYIVQSVNSGGTANSTEKSATPNNPPAAPTGLGAVAGTNQVALAWTGSAGATSYNIKRSTVSGSEVNIASSATTSYTDTTAIKFTTYYYEVSAVSATYGESGVSNETNATPTGMFGPIAYEPFNYTAGNLANGTASTATGISGNWVCGGAGTIVSGLNYANLPATNNALQANGNYQVERLASPQSSGSVWVSVLTLQTGDNGGARAGLLMEDSTGTGLMFAYQQVSGSVGKPALQSMTGTNQLALVNPQLTPISSVTQPYGTPIFYVFELDYTAGVLSSVEVYTDPAANQNTVPTPDFAVTTGLPSMGPLSQIGASGSSVITLDEVRVGNLWADVVGYNPPVTPINLMATPGVNEVSLSWTAVNVATNYIVLRGTSSMNYTVTNNTVSASYNDITAVGGTTYYYAVEAQNASGISTNSLEVSATPTIALPNVPAGVAAVGTNGAVSLTWGVATGAATYNVLRSTPGPGGETFLINVSTPNYYDTAVVNGQTYYYVVQSVNTAGTSANSSEVHATPNNPPAAPTLLTATAATNQVALTWTTSAGATSYNIYRGTSSGGEVVIASVAATSTSTNYTDATAVKFTPYFYEVTAVNSTYGESALSDELSATPLGLYGPVAYEPFNYPLGNLANGTATTANGFAGHWTCGGSGTIVSGLTYPSLPTAGYALQPNGSYQVENLASPQSNGKVWVSVLLAQTGDNGGSRAGFLMEDSTGTGLMFAYAQVGGTVGDPALQFMTGTNHLVSQLIPHSNVTQTYENTNNFYVFELDYTAGVLSSVAVYSNPTADQNTVPSPDFTVTSGLPSMGPLSLLGASGSSIVTIDEIQVGQVWADVVGYGQVAAPTIPTTLSITVAQGTQVSWTAQTTNYYQPQESLNDSTWTNVGGLLVGNAVSAVYQTSPEPYYQVLEYVAGANSTNLLLNGSFEIPANSINLAADWSSSGNDTYDSVYATNSYGGGAYMPTDGTNLMYLEGTTAAVSPTAPDTSLTSAMIPIAIPGAPYTVAFSIVNPVTVGGANQRYIVSWYAGNGVLISTTTTPLPSVGASWTTETNTFTAPANAANMTLSFLQGVGAGANSDWVTLLDNVTVVGPTFAGTNVLTPVLSLGAAYTATVVSNGVTTAISASGTITFLTNGVPLSTNTVAAGAASSATGILTPPYTVTAIYSGDNSYISSTNMLTVNNAVAEVTLGDLLQTNNGSPRTVTVSTIPVGLTVNVTYNGSATAPIAVGSYQVIGTVSDTLYAGSATNTLVVVSGVNTSRTNVVASVSGNQLTLSWPADHTGWTLQAQTNGFEGTWYDVPGSASSDSVTITLDPNQPQVYYRMKY